MRISRVICILVLAIGISSLVSAEEIKRTAKIIDLDGVAEVKPAGKRWTSAKAGMLLNEGDILRTKANSWLVLNLDGKGETATAEMKENSQLMLSELRQDQEKGTQKTLLDLALGKILIEAQKLHSEQSEFEVKTPTSIVGVRGTKFAVEVEALE